MLVKVLSFAHYGVDTFLVGVEVDITNGLPIFNIIGLGDTAISESKHRIKSAIKNIGYQLEPRRIVINLTPANIKKSGSQYDLPMAIGIMIAFGLVHDVENILDEYLIVGELSLNGDIKEIDGVIGGVLLGKKRGFKGVIVPIGNYEEACLIGGIDIVAVENIDDLVRFLELKMRKKVKCEKRCKIEEKENIDMKDIKGQSRAKRALEVAAAGGHNIILVGAPGSGKSMLARRLITILPDMSEEEIIEVTRIYSINGEKSSISKIIKERPFRNPHHTSTVSSILGGGRIPKAGEVTLAHCGVLFFDEFTEFDKKVLDSLREPLDENKISVVRSLGKVEFPSKFMFVAASNPCQCGNYFEEDMCICSSYDIRKYNKKLNGPIMDRIDIYVEIYRLNEKEILNEERVENSIDIKKRVEKAREMQLERFKNKKLNSNMSVEEIEKYCKLDDECKKIMEGAIITLKLSMRSYHKILKVARSIADLDGREKIGKKDILEAINYRKSR